MATSTRGTSRTGTRRAPQRIARPGSGRGSLRPGHRGATPRARQREDFTYPRLTSRAAILVLVAAVLVVSWASSMRAFLQQRAEINQLKVSISQSQRNIAVLKREQRRWHDKHYVIDQARARLGWVLPGQTSYTVLRRDGKPVAGTSELPSPSSAPLVQPAWWSRMNTSLAAADHPEQHAGPATYLGPRKR